MELIIPPILYKYRSLDQEGHLEKMLRYGEIYFAPLKKLNDPCEYYFTFTDPVLRNLSKNEYDELESENKISQEFNSGDQHGNNHAAFVTPEAHTEYMRKSFGIHGIFCMSTCPISISMWAFYGNALDAVCIGFDWSKLGYQLPPYKVQYENEPIKISGPHISVSDIIKIDTTKSSYFAFEQEYRVFDQVGAKSGGQIRGAIREIIFGERFYENKENVKKIINWVRDIPGIKFFIARRVFGKYEIQVSEISIPEFSEIPA